MMTEKMANDLCEFAEKYGLLVAFPKGKDEEEEIGDIQILIDLKKNQMIFEPEKDDFNS